MKNNRVNPVILSNLIGVDIWQITWYFAKNNTTCHKPRDIPGRANNGGNMETMLDRFGRIVIPKKIRDDFNLKPGSQIHIEEGDETIVLKPVHGEPNLISKEGVLVFSGKPIEDLGEALLKHREERTKSIWEKNEDLV